MRGVSTTTTSLLVVLLCLFLCCYVVGATSSSSSSTTTKENNITTTSAYGVVSENGEVVSVEGSTMKRPSDNTNETTTTATTEMIDAKYPGTAVSRMLAVRARVKELATSPERPLYQKPWKDIRKKLLWAGGLKDLPQAIPGRGYTGHAFQDYNHVDLTTMRMDVSSNEHDGSITGIALGNQLGEGIRIASLPELGSGGSWSTCAMGCHHDPPQDVAHVQFQSRIAFKLVWVPPDFTQFVLVDDDGQLLASGHPTGTLPNIRDRYMNYQIVQGSKYAKEADASSSSKSGHVEEE